MPAQIQPSTSVKLLEAILQHFGINDAKVKLVYLPGNDLHELVFSIGKNQFTSSKTHALLKKLGWFFN
ncbi:hypothetical protein [Legionella sp. PC997]|uniref:hypothetical protein n=1 Tax=Legionella sp. PC997 TaxID=2755562 RepID=UPI0021064E7B|nr:hypothetical protein [Legionella sp. PC997]